MNYPAPPNPRANPPSRWIALACNVGLVLMLTVSFGVWFAYGCQPNHLHEAVGAGLAMVTGFLCLAMTVVGSFVFLKHLRRDSSAANILGLVATLIVGLVSTLATPLFWLTSAMGRVNFGGFGGWGRPLRIGQRTITPDVRVSSEWAKGPRPNVSNLDDTTRAVLRDLWLHDARKEHASVPAFGQVAWQLVALGAPSDLVRRAHVSCLQEIDHAERCFALASAYAGQDLGVQAMPALFAGGAELPRDRSRALVKVATEALIDGALLEDYNAELARTALDDVQDPAAREALLRIVEDEADHAKLAWDIIAFCIAEGGPPVSKALAETFARFGHEAVSLYDPALIARVDALADKSPLYAHGRVRFEHAQPVFQARKRVAAETLATLLAHPQAALGTLAA